MGPIMVRIVTAGVAADRRATRVLVREYCSNTSEEVMPFRYSNQHYHYIQHISFPQLDALLYGGAWLYTAWRISCFNLARSAIYISTPNAMLPDDGG